MSVLLRFPLRFVLLHVSVEVLMHPTLCQLPRSDLPEILLCLSPPILRSGFFLVGEVGDFGQVATAQFAREVDSPDLLPNSADRILSPLGAAVLIKRVPQENVEVFVRHCVQLVQADNVEPDLRPLLPTLVALKVAEGLAMLLLVEEVLLMPIFPLFFAHLLKLGIFFFPDQVKLTQKQLLSKFIIFFRPTKLEHSLYFANHVKQRLLVSLI